MFEKNAASAPIYCQCEYREQACLTCIPWINVSPNVSEKEWSAFLSIEIIAYWVAVAWLNEHGQKQQFRKIEMRHEWGEPAR